MTAALLGLCLLIPAMVACLYYFVLTFLGWRTRSEFVSGIPTTRFGIVIPAHNEELGIATTLDSIRASQYPAEKIRVLVIADNCTDRTAEIARQLGAECLERQDDVNRGKGYALELAIPNLLQRDVDAVMILDADCELTANTLSLFDAELTQGKLAIQAPRVARNHSDGPAAVVSAVGSTIENAISAGRSALGLSVALRGSGMVFHRTILERCPWKSYGLTEDAEYTAVLERAGVRIHFLSGGEVQGEVPAELSDLAQQRKRWRASLFAGGPGWLSRWLASKPLVLGHLLFTTLGVLCLLPGMSALWASVCVALLILLHGLTGSVYLRALNRTNVSLRSGSNWFTIGTVVVRLFGVTVSGFIQKKLAWERTRRVAELKAPPLTTGL